MDTSDRGYQYEYSQGNPEMHSLVGRQRKAATMLAILREALGDRLVQADALNLGCSTGIIDAFLAPHVRTMTGVDIDQSGVEFAQAQHHAENLRFMVDDAMQLSFADASFDVVICSQVYEHVPDSTKMMHEIHRVLREGGLCYFAATNRWSVMEKHYHLPFLSWLPSAWSDRYVRLLKRGDAYYERHLGHAELLRLASAFKVEDKTPQILEHPNRFHAQYLFASRLGLWAARISYRYLRAMFPGFIFLLWKHGRDESTQTA